MEGQVSITVSLEEALTLMRAPGVPESIAGQLLASLPELMACKPLKMDWTEEDSEKPIEVTMKFLLPDHQEQFEHALNGKKLWHIIYDLQEDLRNSIRRGAPFNDMDVTDKSVEPVGDVCGKVYPEDPKIIGALEAVQKYLLEKFQDESIKSPY